MQPKIGFSFHFTDPYPLLVHVDPGEAGDGLSRPWLTFDGDIGTIYPSVLIR